MTVSNLVNTNSPTANMFGIEPCPKCRSQYRFMQKRPDGSLIIRCDDCRFEEQGIGRASGSGGNE